VYILTKININDSKTLAANTEAAEPSGPIG